MPPEELAHYRRKAEECRAKAAKVKDSAAQFEWIMMAKSWEILATDAEKDEKPGDLTASRGAGLRGFVTGDGNEDGPAQSGAACEGSP